MSGFSIAAPSAETRRRIDELIREGWAGPLVVSRGKLHDTRGLPGLAAEEAGKLLGYLLYRIDGSECEVVVLEALAQNRGVGTALLDGAKQAAKAAGSRRLWLITTNDNTNAIRFYQKYGLELETVRIGAVDEARKSLKPTIPQLGEDGIPIRHEFVFSCHL